MTYFPQQRIDDRQVGSHELLVVQVRHQGEGAATRLGERRVELGSAIGQSGSMHRSGFSQVHEEPINSWQREGRRDSLATRGRFGRPRCIRRKEVMIVALKNMFKKPTLTSLAKTCG